MKFPSKREALRASLLLLATSGGLFGQAPDVTATKTDSFTPNGAGKVEPGATIRYQTTVSNNGAGVANGVELNDPVPANTTLVPGSVNVSPLAGDDVYQAIVNTQLAAGSPVLLSGPLTTSAAKVTDNDIEFLGDAFTVSAFDSTSAAGGNVVMETSGVNAGSFTYVPPAGYVGADSFHYTLRDDGTDSIAGNADDLTGSGTVVINVVEADTTLAGTQKVWYIDSDYAGANGLENGTSVRPFNALSDVAGSTGPDVAGDTLHLALSSDYTGGITLLADQALVGEGVALVLNGVTVLPPNGKSVITNASGAGITLSTNNTIRGVEVRNTSTVDISGAAVGNLTISATTCTGTGGILTVGTSGALDVSLEEATTTSSSATGIDLNACSGTLTVSTGSLAGIAGTDVNINGGTVAASIAASITNTSGRPVVINGHATGAITLSGDISSNSNGILVQNNTSGTITFSGSSKVINTGTSTAVTLTSNTGATVNFTGGGLDIDTSTTAAFAATGGGTVTVQGAGNTITSTTGTALNVANTTIGLAGLTFQSISANGAANGIVLNATGSSGGLTVLGNGNNTVGGNSSGGTIQNTTGAGILLTDTRNVSLTNMSIQSTADSGIDGTQVTNFTFDNGTINNSGTALGAFMSNIDFNDDAATLVNQLSGAVTITDSVLTNAYYGGVDIQNFTGAIADLTVSNNSIASATSTATSKAPGIRVIAFGGADITRATIDSNTVTNFPSDSGIMVQGGNAVEGGDAGNLGNPGSGTDIIAISNNIISGASAANRIGTQGILANLNGTGNGNFSITGNSVSHTAGNSISHNVFGDAVVTSIINNNTVISNNSLGAQGIGGGTSTTGGFATNTPSLRVTLSGNNISQTDGNGILIVARDNATGVLAAKIVNNTVAAPLAGVRPGIRVDAGNSAAGSDNDVFLEISGNTSAGSGNAQGIGLRKQGTVTATNSFAVRGMTATATPGVESHITSQNPAGNGTLLISATSGFSEWTGTGGQPTFQALLFAKILPDTPFQSFTPEPSPAPLAAALPPVTAENPPSIATSSATTTELTDELLAITTAEAITRWQASGLTPAQAAALRNLRVELVDLDNIHLGQARGNLIQISRKPAGQQWFIDPTPAGDLEFPLPIAATRRSATGGDGSALGKVDLLTTVMHEMGHTIGLSDRYEADARDQLMFGHLTSGERRLPASGEARMAVPFLDETARFLGATINIGTLPPGKSVTIVGTVTVNDPANTQLITSQGTVSGSNFANVLTDDPAVGGTTDITTTPVERPDAAVVSLDRSAAASSNQTSVSWQLVFSQPVSGLAAANFALANTGLGGSPAITSVSPATSAPDTTWNITASTGTGDGTLGLNLANDSALSHDVTNLNFTGAVYTMDRTPPGMSSFTLSDTNLKIGDTAAVTITFAEAVSGFTDADLSAENAAISSLSSSDGGITWTATLTPTASVEDATNLITLDLTGVTDAVGNAGAGTSVSPNYRVDTVRPTATVVVADSSLRVGETSLVTITFSEAVTGFTNADLTIENGGLSSVSSSDGGITWTATFTPTGSVEDATNLISLDNAGVSDAAGNAGGGTTNSNNYAIDTRRPTATVVVADSSLTAVQNSLVTITFNEAVTGFTNADLSVENGELSSVSSSDGGITWTATLTPTPNITDPTNVITLENTGVSDLAGNAGSGTTDSNNYAITSLSVSIAATGSSAAEGNGGGSTAFTFNVSRTGDATGDVTMDYAVSGAAVNAVDFGGTLPSGQVTIPDGSSSTSLTINVSKDATVEPNEAFTVTLSNASSGYSINTAAASSTINNDDAATVTVAKINDGVESASPTNALFRVTQTAAASTNTVVNYTVSGTATTGSDFTTPGSSVTILAGQTFADINIAVLDETVVEPTETVSIDLTGFSSGDPEISLGATLTASANITDNDTSVITLTGVSADKTEGTGGATTPFTFSVSLSNPVQGGFTIAYTTNDGTSTAGSDYTDNDGSLVFAGTSAESQTITVPVIQDGMSENDESFTVSLGAITNTTLGASLRIAAGGGLGVIRNDDLSYVYISAPDAAADENSAGTGTFRLTRNFVLGNTTVQLQIDPASTAVAADWTQTGANFTSLAPGSTGTIVIPEGQTSAEFTLAPSADHHAEAAETVIINFTNSSAYTLTDPTSATVTIGQNDFVVINTNDSGEGSLRQAMLNSNNLAGAETITFEGGVFTDATLPDIIDLAGMLPSFSGQATVAGPGADKLVIRRPAAAASFGLMQVFAGADVTLNGLTLSGGDGGIANVGSLRVDHCNITGNTSATYGGILNNGTLVVTGSTISGNSSTSGVGGGIYNLGGRTLSVFNSTISGNSSKNGGAGIATVGGSTVLIANSTVSGNMAGSSGAGIGNNGALTVINSTITGNSGTGQGGGIATFIGSSLTLANSIVAGNTATSEHDINTFSSSNLISSNGANFIGDATGAAGIAPTDKTFASTGSTLSQLLSPLADNGGPTLTHSLVNLSPAINGGDNNSIPNDTFDLDGDTNTTESIPYDQRGTGSARVIGATVDIGAFEAFAFEPAITAAKTDEDLQSSTGLVITANAADGGLTTHYKITGTLNGTLYQNDGTTAIAAASFITKAQGLAGLKFTPAADLNNVNTASFGFSAQAALGDTDAGLRGTAQAATIAVNPVNDAPTVVAPGLENQTMVIGSNRSIPLASLFADIDGGVLGFSVVANSNSSSASATIIGTEVALNALATGVTNITILADDGLGGTVSDTFLVSVGTVNPTPLQTGTTGTLNRQNGLFELTVNVTNTTPLPINGFRLHVDFSAYLAAYPSLRLYNATSPAGHADVYVDYPYPVPLNGVVPLKLSFYTSTRTFPDPFSPLLAVETLASSQVPGTDGGGVHPRIVPLPDRTILLEFPSVAGRWYRVRYSSDLQNWSDSPVPVQASTNRMQWIDSGPPFTDASPAVTPSRYYRVNEIAAP